MIHEPANRRRLLFLTACLLAACITVLPGYGPAHCEEAPGLKGDVILPEKTAETKPAGAVEGSSQDTQITQTEAAETAVNETPSAEAAPASSSPPAEKPSALEAPAPEKDPERQAADLYNRGVELFGIGEVQASKGNIRGQQDLLKQAIKNFESALALNPALADAQSNIGFAWLTLKKFDKAVEAFNKALVLDPHHLNSLNGLATTYAFAEKIDQAMETFDRLTTLDPGNAQYFFNKGSALQKAGRTEGAIEAYQAALKLAPDDQRVLFNLGTAYDNLGELEKAKPYYAKAKSLAIGNPIGLEAFRRLELLDAQLQEKEKAQSDAAEKQAE